MNADDLQVTSRREGRVGTLVVGGEVRMEIAATLLEAGEALFADGARHLIVNLERVAFMDSASLSALIGLDTQAGERGGKIVLCHVSPAVDLVLDNSGLHQRFAVAPDEDAALALVRAE
jgi:stage II sporulation protein AA (anti-sigma F factor antagonist)